MKEKFVANYVVLPMFVRHAKNLSANAKLLYGEIHGLCHTQPYCTESNKYFAELYGVSERSITKWITELVESEFVRRNVITNPKTSEVIERRLFPLRGNRFREVLR